MIINSTHELEVLTALKNAIRVLQGNDITDINVRNDNGRTPLHRAAYNDHLDMVQALLEHGSLEISF